MSTINFKTVELFEQKIAEFFGAPYGIAVDSCTHGIELCLRYKGIKEIDVPKRTYLSVAMLAEKLNIKRNWVDIQWQDYYHLASGIYDAAVLWRKDAFRDIASYYPIETETYLNISFQYQKHLKLGRGGMILTNNKEAAIQLKKMSYDGRLPNIPWREQNIDTIGYHYYLLPELAQLGLERLPEAIKTEPKQWKVEEWPDLTKMDVFKQMS